jgi:hypothetical protein
MDENLMRVLHLSHHYGCLKDHQYVCEKLGIELETRLSIWNQIIPRDTYKITKDYANEVWNDHSDYFNSFDYIITSDTAPLSRIFLQNIHKLKPNLIVWICNRFDYNMEGDSEYYSLFREATKWDRVKIIPYTEFERVWASQHDINITEEVIRPIGITSDTLLNGEEPDGMVGFGGDYEEIVEGGDILISRYHNDNIFQNSQKMFEKMGLKATVCKYKGRKGLENLSKIYNAFFILPEQYSKLVAFELMHLKMPVILPSDKLLLHLARIPNYWFGSGLYNQTVDICEWYNEYYDKFAVYVEDFSEIPEAYQTILTHKKQICDIMEECSIIHKEKVLNQWRKIYNV